MSVKTITYQIWFVGEREAIPLNTFESVEIQEKKNSAMSLCTIEIPSMKNNTEIDVIKKLAANVRETAFEGGRTGGTPKRGTPKQKGYRVIVLAGYQESGGLRQEFSGWLTEVSPTQPFTIKASGEGIYLTETTIEKSYFNQSVKSIVEDIGRLCGFSRVVVSDKLATEKNDFRLEESTAYQALEKLRERNGGLEYYVDENGTLYFGYRNGFEIKQKSAWEYRLDSNTLDDKLALRKSKVDGVKIYRVSRKGRNHDVAYFPPDVKNNPNASIAEERVYGVSTTLEKLAERRFYELNYAGFAEGSYVKGYGYPPVRIGNVVYVSDPKSRSELEGFYYCDEQIMRMRSIGGVVRGGKEAVFSRQVFLGERVKV